MAVCPVCFANNAQDDTVCPECGADLSLPPDTVQKPLLNSDSPFSSSISPRSTDDATPLLCNACGSENPSNARFCVNCRQSFYQTVMPPKRRSKFVYLLVAAAIIYQIVVISVIFNGISYFTGILYDELTYLYIAESSMPEAEYIEASYDDYAEKPDGVMGDNIKVTGTVTQIEKEFDKYSDFLTIYLSEDFEGEKIWRIGYHLKDNEMIEVGDILTFYGMSHGLVKLQEKNTGEPVYCPVIRASVFSDDDAISGKTWTEEDNIFMFTLRDDGTCTVVIGKGTEDEFTDTGTYSVYRGKAAVKYIVSDVDELGLTSEELVSEFELRENIGNFYCLTLFRDKEEQDDDNSAPVPTILYFGFYSEESGELAMFSSSTLSFVTLTEVTE